MNYLDFRHMAMISSQDWHDYARLKTLVALNLPPMLVSGGAGGADTLAERLARERGLTIDVMSADRQRYGRGAGLIRHKQIVKSADLVIALWDGKSSGTCSALAHAEKVGVPVKVHHCDGTVTD